MTDTEKNINVHFFTLVSSLQVAAWQQMGKIASPITGKVERNLDQARASIDMLSMLSEKTKGNLDDEEEKLLSRMLYELRMNYLDESQKPPDETADKKETPTESGDSEAEKPTQAEGEADKKDDADA